MSPKVQNSAEEIYLLKFWKHCSKWGSMVLPYLQMIHWLYELLWWLSLHEWPLRQLIVFIIRNSTIRHTNRLSLNTKYNGKACKHIPQKTFFAFYQCIDSIKIAILEQLNMLFIWKQRIRIFIIRNCCSGWRLLNLHCNVD